MTKTKGIRKDLKERVTRNLERKKRGGDAKSKGTSDETHKGS